jgi:hypothetical protein
LQSLKQSFLSVPESERANAIEYLQELGHNGTAERGRLTPDASPEPKSKETWFSKHQSGLAISAFISFPVMLMGSIIAMMNAQFARVDTQFATVNADIRSINADIRSMSKDIANMRVDIGRLLLITGTPPSADATREQAQPPDVLADAGPPGQSAPPASGPAEPVTQ